MVRSKALGTRLLTALIGLIASTMLYLVAIYAFVWTGERRMRWGEQHGVLLSPEPKFPTAADVWKRHSVDMTVIYFVAFVLLALMDFTILERLGFAALGRWRLAQYGSQTALAT